MSYNNSYDNRKGFPVGGFILGLVILAVLLIPSFIWGWFEHFWRLFFVEWQAGGIILGSVLLTGLIAIILTTMYGGKAGVTFIVPIGILIAMIIASFSFVYNQQRAYLEGVSVENVAPDINFDQRVPFEIAGNQVEKNMGDSLGTAQDVHSMAGEGNYGLWNTLVVKRGFVQGYESVISIDSPTYGNVSEENVRRCFFSDNATLRFGGALANNDLGRAIIDKVFWSNVTYHQEDAYGYCDGDTPYVVTPLVSVQGWYVTHDVPWGLAIYNGTTGQLTITQDPEVIKATPGPTYPITVARSQRQALQAYDGDWWNHVQGLLGWDTEDGNNEIQIRVSDTDKTVYFNALQPRGSSTNVTAESMVNAEGFTPNQYNKLTVYVLPHERTANATVDNNIKTQYSWMPAFSSTTSNYQLYEIVPGQNGGWVASVGTDQSVVYRVVIDSTGNNVTLVDAKTGKEITQAGVVNNPDGTTTVVPDTTGSVDGMSEDQLIALLGQITERLKELNSGTTVPTPAPTN